MIPPVNLVPNAYWHTPVWVAHRITVYACKSNSHPVLMDILSRW